ncbi:TPA: hypothetical protein ACGUWU_004316 [Vibrio vulnificus]
MLHKYQAKATVLQKRLAECDPKDYELIFVQWQLVREVIRDLQEHQELEK